ncbi:MAG TPA: acyl-CoA dehydrogenase family protein [Acidimicrobiales bacterium]|jgi:alkylation response protein AidB-like acyl-CoA dehydrogenase
MDLLPTPEQEEIASSAAAFLARALPRARTRELFGEPSNVDAKAWLAAADLGWFALGLPSELGGVGGGLADEALLFREIGRSLAPGPFLATTLAVRVASFAGQAQLGQEISAGRRVGFGALGAGATLTSSGVTGTLYVVDGDDTDLVLVSTDERAGLFDRAELGDLTTLECLDPTSRLSRATAANPHPVATVEARVDPVGRRATALVAALLTGIAEATGAIATEHAKSRNQFGRPIGVHQAVKHPCADMAVRAELSWAQTAVAALATDEGRRDAELQCLSALVVAADAAERNGAATVQVLGGMGFTFEHDAQLYVKRVFLLTQLLAPVRLALSRLVLLPGPE